MSPDTFNSLLLDLSLLILCLATPINSSIIIFLSEGFKTAISFTWPWLIIV